MKLYDDTWSVYAEYCRTSNIGALTDKKIREGWASSNNPIRQRIGTGGISTTPPVTTIGALLVINVTNPTPRDRSYIDTVYFGGWAQFCNRYRTGTDERRKLESYVR